MPFPASERVIYRKPPLVEAICQLKFPSILRIQTEIPTRFQEAVRDRFPVYHAGQPTVENQFLSENVQLSIPMTRSHRFATEDGGLFATLTSDFIALTANKDSYGRFANFRESFSVLVEAVEREYRPQFYNRIGLRYQNLISREDLDLKDAWSDLLQPCIAGELGSPELRERIYGRAAEVIIRLRAEGAIEETDGRGSFIKLRHGFASAKGARSNTPGYLIDLDLYTEEKTESPQVFSKLEVFNDKAARAFRWCISDRLYAALEPEPAS